MDDTKVMVTSRDGTQLATYVRGAQGGETVVLIHGFPDTHRVWDAVAVHLAPGFRVVRYDVRGAGASDRPTETEDYDLDRLVEDADAVLRAHVPKGRVHLVGHDWGSIQGWEIAYRLADRVASFTSISGPCLDHAGALLRELRHDADARRYARDQLFRSWYIGVLTQPNLVAKLVRPAMRDRFADDLRRFEGIDERDEHPAPTFVDDFRAGSRLYAANMRARIGNPRARPVRLPVKLIVPTADRFVSERFADVVRRFVPDLSVERLDAGHWCLISRATHVASAIAEHVRAHPSR